MFILYSLWHHLVVVVNSSIGEEVSLWREQKKGSLLTEKTDSQYNNPLNPCSKHLKKPRFICKSLVIFSYITMLVLLLVLGLSTPSLTVVVVC